MRVLDKTVVQLDLNKIGMEAGMLVEVPRDHQAAQRHRARHGTDRFRQDDDAVLAPSTSSTRSTEKIITTEDPIEYDIDGLVQCPINPDIDVTFANVPAGDPAARPRQDPRRRDPRLRDGGNRHSGGPHRAPCVQHAAHQRRPQRHHAAPRHGRAGVPDHRDRRSDSGPAVGAQDLHGLQDAVRAQRRPA